MKNNKAPGLSAVTTDMLKNVPEEGITLLTTHIQEFWESKECNYDTWHKTKLTLLYKGKGNHHDPNSWRGICLKETSAKIISAILPKRLLKNLERTMSKINQFSHIGCQEALQTLRSALILWRQHGLETYALFVDLVKAFDTINYSLLIIVLSKYGIPPTMCRTIAKLYKNCKVQLKTGKSTCEIEYKTGMQQGDNMALILFLYIMQAAIESLHTKLTCNKLEFHYFPDKKSSTCQYIEDLLCNQS